jgi:DNA (cytosine-5)-methyltransferase 1
MTIRKLGTFEGRQVVVIKGQKPRLLDLFCGAGGAAMGYHRAGFEVVGVDIKPQPHYPFEFIQADVMDLLSREGTVDNEWRLGRFDVIHASPPCQGYANLGNDTHPRLIAPVREALRAIGLPYVIENIQDAKPFMEAPVVLCGSSFGLHVRRHRLFESSELLMAPGRCQHKAQGEIRGYYGKPGWLCWTPGAAAFQKKGRRPLLRGSVEKAPADMGIDWMTWDELREAIPPDYTEWIGKQLMDA